MVLITCIDEKNGMLFNNRRQSRDKILTNRVLDIVNDNKLWITSFSQDLFDIVEAKNIITDNDFINKIGKNDYCFIEDVIPSSIINNVDKVIIYNWNRHYPADQYFDISLEGWTLTSEYEFTGTSHEKITEKIYIRREG